MLNSHGYPFSTSCTVGSKCCTVTENKIYVESCKIRGILHVISKDVHVEDLLDYFTFVHMAPSIVIAPL